MRLHPHTYYILTEPGGDPRRVTFLAYKGGKNNCLIIDFDNPKPHSSVYRRVPREWLSEVEKKNA